MLSLAHSTWPEVKDFIAAPPVPVVLLSLGATEAHGPHLPIATDVIIADGMARRAAIALENRGHRVVLAPTIPYALTDCAADFPGTVGVDALAAETYVVSVLAGLRRSGFARVCLISAHLEPAHVQGLLRAARRATSSELSVVFADKTAPRFARTLPEEFRRAECHAGAYETALVAAEAPGALRASAASALPPVRIDLARAFREGKHTFVQAGADAAYFGDPAAGHAAAGEWIYLRLVDMIVTVVEEAWPDHPAPRP